MTPYGTFNPTLDNLVEKAVPTQCSSVVVVYVSINLLRLRERLQSIVKSTYVCVTVCLSVCLREYFRNHTRNLY